MRRTTWGKPVKVFLIFFTFLLCVSGILYTQTDIGEAAGSYDKNLVAAKRLGLPMTDEDVERIRSGKTKSITEDRPW